MKKTRGYCCDRDRVVYKKSNKSFFSLLILLNTFQFWWLLSLALNNSIINIYTFGVLIFIFPDTIRITYGHCVCTNQYKCFPHSKLVLYARNHTKRREIWDQFLLMIIAMFNSLFLVLQSVRWTHWIWITDGTARARQSLIQFCVLRLSGMLSWDHWTEHVFSLLTTFTWMKILFEINARR